VILRKLRRFGRFPCITSTEYGLCKYFFKIHLLHVKLWQVYHICHSFFRLLFNDFNIVALGLGLNMPGPFFQTLGISSLLGSVAPDANSFDVEGLRKVQRIVIVLNRDRTMCDPVSPLTFLGERACIFVFTHVNSSDFLVSLHVCSIFTTPQCGVVHRR